MEHDFKLHVCAFVIMNHHTVTEDSHIYLTLLHKATQQLSNCLTLIALKYLQRSSSVCCGDFHVLYISGSKNMWLSDDSQYVQHLVFGG